MNKKVIAAGMAMVLASMGLTACGDSGSKEAKDSSDETYTVTMHIWEGDSPDIWDETKALNESAIKSKAFGFTYDSTSVANELAALSNVKAKYAAALGSGTVDPEETLPKFIEELKKAGIEKVISTKQEQLDKWLEENK